MKLLLIDTCGASGSIAFAEDGIAREVAMLGRSSAEQLIPSIREALNGSRLADLDAIAVVNGPGSFTGVRVGVSAAKGLAEAANRPLIALSRLAVLAARRPQAPSGDASAGINFDKHAEGDAQPSAALRVHAVLDAGRGEFYHGVFGSPDEAREALNGPPRTRREHLSTLAEFAASFAESPGRLAVCEAAVAEGLRAFAPLLLAPPTAADALPLAMIAYRDGEFADAAALDGRYLRRAEEEMLATQKSHQARAAASAR